MGENIYASLPATQTSVTQEPDGSFIVASQTELKPYERCVGDWLERWAEERGDQIFIGERQGEGWRALGYREFRNSVHRVAQGLLNLGLADRGPLVILSGNSVDHALIMMAAMHIGIPVTSVSVAYSLVAKTHEKLASIVERLRPCAVYADDALQFADALAACEGVETFISSRNHLESDGVLPFEQLLNTQATDAVTERFNALTPESHAKYMLTSGSTGVPKVVVNTQRMLCSNQQMVAQYYSFLESDTPRVLDWLPWSHTFGTNHNFNLVLRNGGTLYIDNGKPVPGLIEESVRNLKEIKPNLYFNVPKGFEVLLGYLREDESFRQSFFSSVNMLFYAAAALPGPIWDELKEMCAETGNDVFFTTEWGSTETAPANTNVHWRLEKAGNIGIPLPGVQIRFVPNGSKLEMRIKGPNVFSEYLNDPETTADSFDEQGFYRIGDAGRLVDPEDASKGILFDGRVSEDFKLCTGTWVCVATIRANVHKYLGDLVADAVVTGHDQDYLGLMLVPGPGMRKLAGDKDGTMTGSELMANPAVRSALENELVVMAKQSRGSAQRVCRALILETPPSLEQGEVTDKGNLNQRRLLETRAEYVQRLYDADVHESVISII
ncbi:feruloyl-CoA synthase [Marinobacterium mangrovicola]|uniref:Trans-feruloyl-CoA synthase n=1 Tax=Marinobacterium mangrovicola TaxID=1476959 RepID=A0A4R1GC13_9GAMM|nr:feruloyl-CoA synthase [Marinobacterium mangrovicola]TCK04291.1 trans-feruloyl-CoA synthase [Marinobacterium mangrovicola]